MKKSIAILLAIMIAAFACAGCTPQPQADEGPNYQDQAFLTDLGKGLDARWTLVDQDEENNPDEANSSEKLESYIQAELDCIDGYSNAEFEDSQLHELAISYINVLNESMKAAESYSLSDTNSLLAWNNVYSDRVIILKDLASNYAIPVSNAHQSNLKDIVADGKAAQQTEDNDAAIQQLADSIVFTFNTDEFGIVTGTATAVNSTGLNLKSVIFDVQMYDASGVRIESTTTSANNWNDGETIVLNAYVSSNTIPATVKVVPNYYEIAD